MSIAELNEFSKKEIEKNPMITMTSNDRKGLNDKPIEQYAENSNIKSWLYQQSYALFDNDNNKLIKAFIEDIFLIAFKILTVPIKLIWYVSIGFSYDSRTSD